MGDLNVLKKTPGFWYVASPYSHDDDLVREHRAIEVNHYTGLLLSAGVHVYSPIWATHRACINHDLPKDHLFWLAFNKAFIDPALGIIVANIDGWRASKGCLQEIAYAHSTGKPVFLCEGDLSLLPLNTTPADLVEN